MGLHEMQSSTFRIQIDSNNLFSRYRNSILSMTHQQLSSLYKTKIK